MYHQDAQVKVMKVSSKDIIGYIKQQHMWTAMLIFYHGPVETLDSNFALWVLNQCLGLF